LKSAIESAFIGIAFGVILGGFSMLALGKGISRARIGGEPRMPKPKEKEPAWEGSAGFHAEIFKEEKREKTVSEEEEEAWRQLLPDEKKRQLEEREEAERQRQQGQGQQEQPQPEQQDQQEQDQPEQKEQPQPEQQDQQEQDQPEQKEQPQPEQKEQPEPGPAAAPDRPQASEDKASILYIEYIDTQSRSAGLIKGYFERKGYYVEHADGTEAGLSAIREKLYKVIICDDETTDIKGDRTVKDIKSMDAGQKVIFYSSRADLLSDDEKAAIGADAYVTKKDIEKLVAEVQGMVG